MHFLYNEANISLCSSNMDEEKITNKIHIYVEDEDSFQEFQTSLQSMFDLYIYTNTCFIKAFHLHVY